MLPKVVFTFMAVFVLLLGAMATSIAEAGGNGPAGRGQNGPGQRSGTVGGSELCNLDSRDSLSQDEIDSLLFMREEEKVARDRYLVLNGLRGLVIFANISLSEQQHMDAIKGLISCYELKDPVIDRVGELTDSNLQYLFDGLMTEGRKSAMDGLYVGALIEETNTVDIQQSIDISVHENIAATYESLMYSSRNYIRTFIRQIEGNGGSYTPTVLEPAEFWAIAHAEMEQDCGSY